MQFENMKMPKLVAVQFRSRYKKDTFSGGEYTYLRCASCCRRYCECSHKVWHIRGQSFPC